MDSGHYFNERLSDKDVIRSLLRHIKKISMEQSMSIFKDTDGQIKRATEFVDVTRDELVASVDAAEKNLASAQAELASFDALTAPEPVQETPQEQPQPIEVVEQPDQDPAPVVAEQPAPQPEVAQPQSVAEQPAPETTPQNPADNIVTIQ